jgi:hypothetical protein
MEFDAGDTKKSTEPITSSGSPSRPSGMREMRLEWNAESANIFATCSLRMKVRATTFTLIPLGAHSAEADGNFRSRQASADRFPRSRL